MIRILIVDDNESIHNDFNKVLLGKNQDKLRNVEMALFGEDDPDLELNEPQVEYRIDHAFQGEDAIEMVDRASEGGDPYALIFMDVRMPPGMDGIKAASKIWQKHPDPELVICTAHSDYTWGEIIKEVGASGKLQFLRKPFDMVTVQQMALSCYKKHEEKQASTEAMQRYAKEQERLSDFCDSQEGLLDEITSVLDPLRQRCENDDDVPGYIRDGLDQLNRMLDGIRNALRY
ncbi:MAG: response regulator [Acidobacteriota bacterium]|nr:response regulator [Acidobacteriota bacterium]